MNIKFNKFYYNNEVHSSKEFWDFYKKDSIGAYKKYNEKIYCPSCHTAPLTIVRGNNRHFRVSNSNMHLHADNCPYRSEEATKHKTVTVHRKANDEEIALCIESCMNTLINGKKQGSHTNIKREEHLIGGTALLFPKNKKERKKPIPRRLLNGKLSADDVGVEKTFYGSCRLYTIKKEDYSILKILNDNYKELCSLKITNKVLSYLPKNFILPGENKKEAKKYNVCFFCIMEKKEFGDNIYFNGSLRHSGHILLRKI